MKRLVFGGLALLSVAPLVRAWQRGRAARPLRRWQNMPMPTTWPSVSVIIPAWQEAGTLEGCLSALAYEPYGSRCEIIVVAGGVDGTLELAFEAAKYDRRIRVLPQRTGGGKNGAINDAAKVASGEVLVFLDADTVVTPGWLVALVASLGTDYAASTGRFLAEPQTLIARAGEMSQLLENEARGRVLLQGSGGMAVRREVFDALGGIPEGPFADDWALSMLLREAGHRLAYAPAAVSRSERPSNVGEFWRNELRWRRLHLLSLFRVGSAELASPLSAAKALYPYATAWGVLTLMTGTLVAQGTRSRFRRPFEVAWLVLAAPALAREVAGALETTAYTGEVTWLQMIPVLPVLTVLTWAASALATLTTNKARLHFKGPRRPMPIDHGPSPSGGAQGSTVKGVATVEARAGAES